jgi:AcrR family transcriptional regulator
MVGVTAPVATASMEVPRRGRRPQPERRAAMRARLLDATIECLAELGWARTSLPEVVRKAGVARGAQVHHFPTKSELLVAATEHLLERLRSDYVTAFEALPPARRTIDAAIDTLWDMLQGPTWAALVELFVAARTDDAVREAMGDLSERAIDISLEIVAEYFPDSRGSQVHAIAVRGGMALFVGLAVQAGIDGDRRGHHAEVLEGVKLLARNLIPSPRGRS